MDYSHMVTGLLLVGIFFLIGSFVSLGFGKKRQILFSGLLSIIGVMALAWAAILVLDH